MAKVELKGIAKVYDGGVRAVFLYISLIVRFYLFKYNIYNK